MSRLKRKVKISHEEVELKKLLEGLAVFVLLALVLAGIYVIEPTITGFIVFSKEVSYTDTVNLVLNESGEYVWNLANKGKLKSIKVSGIVENEGSVKIYVENNGNRFLIFDSDKLEQKEFLDKITGFVVNENNGNDPNHPPVWNSSLDSFVVGSGLVLNLNDYFNDRDGDVLGFSASELNTNDLEILLDGSLLSISNKNNASGNRTVELYATDGDVSKKKNVVMVLLNGEVNETEEETEVDETEGKLITINLEYKTGTEYDVDDNGIETATGIVDMDVGSTNFNWEVDENNVCTVWETYSVENEESTFVCYGSTQCCSLVSLSPAKEVWKEVFHSYFGLYGATSNNLVTAQVVYADYNLSVENASVEIVKSGFDNLSVKFYTGAISFEDVCEETCSVFGFNESSYKLVFELNNTILTLNDIDYVIEKNFENEAPVLINNIDNITIAKNSEYIINLSEYFSDDEKLEFSYYEGVENLSFSIGGSIITISPDEDFIGARFVFFTASDGELSTSSNVFRVDVKEVLEIGAGSFEVRNLEDEKLAVWDGKGNLNIKGSLTENNNISFSSGDFIIENKAGNVNMVVTNPEGDLLLKGEVNQNLSNLEFETDSFIIENNVGEIVSYVSGDGELFLRGILKEEIVFV